MTNVPATPLLEVEGLAKAFAGVLALHHYSLRLEPLVIHGVIGPNGAGKTTLFNLLTGFLAPTAGHDPLARAATSPARPPAEIARLGIARTFQNIRLFGQLPVLENVKAALQSQVAAGRSSARCSRRPAFLRRERDAGAAGGGRSWSCSAWRAARPPGARTSLRRPAPAGDRPRRRREPQDPAARRAERGHEPEPRRQDLLAPDPPAARRTGDHYRPGRPRHPAGDEPVRPHPGAQLRASSSPRATRRRSAPTPR